MEKRTYNPCDECPHGIDRRDGSGNDAMCRICEFNAYLKLGTIDHLRDLHQAEQDGQLVVLPCKVGDTIWRIKCFADWPDIGKPYVEADAFLYRDIHYFGKTVFLTRDKAEEALAKEGGTHEDTGGL